jgi:sulfhydrogenase subunit delta
MGNPKVAVYKFSSCDGCQLSILNLEDELLDLAGLVEIAYFLEATSRIAPGPYDIALVEGSITTPHEVERIKAVRQEARFLVALGTCATSGGIQALRNFTNVEDLAHAVYPKPEYLHTLESSTPIADHVDVDLELWGCPVNKFQILEVIQAILQDRKPNLPPYSVCLDCKRHGAVCVLVAQGVPCLGPVTRTGCGAICPSLGRGCYGCFGPAPEGNIPTFVNFLLDGEGDAGEVFRLFRNVNANAPAFRLAAELALEKEASDE